MKWTLRLVVWAVWQLFVLLVAIVLFANLFSEYGVYRNRFVNPVAAVVLFLAAVWFGTWLPVRQWRTNDRQNHENGAAPGAGSGGAH